MIKFNCGASLYRQAKTPEGLTMRSRPVRRNRHRKDGMLYIFLLALIVMGIAIGIKAALSYVLWERWRQNNG